MTWVNLDDVYVSKTGGTVAGNLAVEGNLIINDKKGTNTTYDVASQISTLRDSVSQCHPIWSVIFLTKDQTPASVGISGTWVKTSWAICTNRRFVFDIKDGQTGANGANVQIYNWNNTDSQKFWFYTADYGDVTMWVRTA